MVCFYRELVKHGWVNVQFEERKRLARFPFAFEIGVE